ncbi:DUF1453 domain-containing protein [Streptomyces sp. NPDC001822]|uniref:DUF1453 domain-containing protein n=1 Tax=Streptomyces sp. NPDC001822 TaxID=3364614 RepID=UPI00367EC682
MSRLFDVLVICAVLALLVARQFSAQRVGDERRWWVLPAVLTFVALKSDGVIDPHHEAISGAMLGAGLLVGLITGAGWGWTARLWQEPDASVWSRGTRATLFIWAGGMGLRVSLAAAALALGIHQGTPALLVSLAAMLLARSGVLVLRTRSLREQYGDAVAVAAGVMPPTPAQSMGKGRA